MIYQTANILTITRVVLAFFAIALVPLAPEALYTYLLMIFILAAITDFVDGYIARKFNIVSDFGKIFDPLADKVLTFVFLIILYPLGVIPQVIILLLIARDLVVDGVRGALVSEVVVPAIFTAKAKTTLIFLLIIGALSELVFGLGAELRYLIIGLAVLALIFSYVSALQYAQIFYVAHKSRKSE